MVQTVLMVDDEPDARVLFQQNFRREIRKDEYQFLYAQSGPEALDILRSEKSDDIIILLSDINMPEMTGLELLEKTKSMNPDLPVVMISAYGDAVTTRVALEKGALSLLAKPIDFPLLKSTLAELTSSTRE